MNISNELIRKSAETVINREAKAVERLVDNIDDNFFEAVKVMLRCKGRIAVTGVGKSAIIARKIAATMTSTGTPAFFLHLADAMHGDLGAVQREDVVLCLSKSGNSQEVKAFVPFIKQRGNILIGMVSDKESFLGNRSDIILYTPVDREACPNNLAPTSSTTVQMVMGDAIAMSLCELRGFSEDDFAQSHPGGSLGKRLYMRVYDVFDPALRPSVSAEENVQNTIINISSHRLGATVVLGENGTVDGIITDGDVRRMVEKGLHFEDTVAADIMSKSPKTIESSSLALDAFKMMEQYKITSVIVMKNGEYQGLIHIHDILREGIAHSL